MGIKNNMKWDKMYSIVLIANAIYIILFYFIMKSF